MRSLLIALCAIPNFTLDLAAQEVCKTKDQLVNQVREKYFLRDDISLKFRIKRQEDGQSLVYWHLGGEYGNFYAVTFRANGCAALIGNNEYRRFVFPKTAYNTGVFWSLDPLTIN